MIRCITRRSLASAGMVTELSPETVLQINLFNDAAGEHRRESLMADMDELKSRYGCNTVTFCSALAAAGPAWRMKQEFRSPCYTTRVSDLVRVR